MTKKRLLTIFVPVIILLGMTVIPLLTILSGEEIILQTKPVDPRDIFRGDYVILSYEIEEIDLDLIEENLKDKLIFSSLPHNKELYVTLKEESGVHVVEKVTEKKPTDSTTYMEAKYRYVRDRSDMSSDEGDSKLIVTYKIDKYFVPENTGTELEEAARNGELMAKVKVNNGYALLREIYPK